MDASNTIETAAAADADRRRWRFEALDPLGAPPPTPARVLARLARLRPGPERLPMAWDTALHAIELGLVAGGCTEWDEALPAHIAMVLAELGLVDPPSTTETR